MGRTLHSVIRLLTLTILAAIPLSSSAECVPVFGPAWECDFKNEDTHLWLNQPGYYHQREENLKRLIEETRKSVIDYVASIKTTGDGHILPHLATIEAAINGATTQTLASVGIILDNDPFHLKTTYLDITRCIPFWSVAFDKSCPTTLELPLLIEQTLNLTELQQLVDQIRANPFKVLGEEWGDIGEDINEIKAEFNRGKTLARNLTSAGKATELDTRFPGYAAMLTAPRMNYRTLEVQRTELSATVQHTLIDTLKAAAMTSRGQLEEDRAEVETLQWMNRNAVGMMQEIEISNMNSINAAGAWTKIVEQQMNLGNLIGIDMANELYTEDRLAAEDKRSMAVDPLNPTILGDEPAPFFR